MAFTIAAGESKRWREDGSRIHLPAGTCQFTLQGALLLMHPLLNQTFWHGTCEGYLPGILAKGLVPSEVFSPHICLTNDPQIALFYARLTVADPFRPGGSPVLIEIPPGTIDEASVAFESNTQTVGSYGSEMPGRGRSDLVKILNDWENLLVATGILGLNGTVPVTSSMVTIICDLEPDVWRNYKAEYDTGRCSEDARKWLHENIGAPRGDDRWHAPSTTSAFAEMNS